MNPREHHTPRVAALRRPPIYGKEVYDPLSDGDDEVAATPPSVGRGTRSASRVSPAAESQAKQLFPCICTQGF
jgi:hypothetical protein